MKSPSLTDEASLGGLEIFANFGRCKVVKSKLVLDRQGRDLFSKKDEADNSSRSIGSSAVSGSNRPKPRQESIVEGVWPNS